MNNFLRWLCMISVCFSCSRDNLPPGADFNVIPPTGNTKTIFDLDASASVDPDGLPQLLDYRWDVNGDGVWDTPFGAYRIFSCQYEIPGTYLVRLEVRDPFGSVTPSEYSLLVDSLHYMTDNRDGRMYPIVKLGGLWWMAKNLNVGEILESAVNQSDNDVIEKYVYPDFDSEKYGGLYQWNELMDYGRVQKARGICPEGWHIPDDAEWRSLMDLFKDPAPRTMPTYEIKGNPWIPDQLVQHNNYHASGAIWCLLAETGSTGFDIRMLGYRDPGGAFGDADYHFPGRTATFWTSTQSGNQAVRVRFYLTDEPFGEGFRFIDNSRFAFSVRCVKTDQ